MIDNHILSSLTDIYHKIIKMSASQASIQATKQIESQILKIELQLNLEKYPNKQYYAILAINFHNITIITQNELYLQKAINILKNIKISNQDEICWVLQLAAFTSATQNHNDAYTFSKIAIEETINKIKNYINHQPNLNKDLLYQVLQQFQQKNLGEQVWLYNQNKLIKSINSISEYYFNDNFQIADVMALKIIDFDYFNHKIQSDYNIIDCYTLIMYLSIGCFTRATQYYYLKCYQDKIYHIKSINIALFIISENSNYIQFLVKTLKNHYAKYLSEIKEQKSQISELIYRLPKNPKQVNTKNLPIIMD